LAECQRRHTHQTKKKNGKKEVADDATKEYVPVKPARKKYRGGSYRGGGDSKKILIGRGVGGEKYLDATTSAIED